MKKVAFITGITGQDGAYLCKFLLSKSYLVVGGFRRTSSPNFWRLNELGLLNHPDLKLVEFDITDMSSIMPIISKYEVNEIYNLAAQSFVGASFDQPINTSQINGIGCLNILESIRKTNNEIKFYQASTSEMFGLVQEIPQTEKTAFYPRSPYGVAKLYAHWMTVNYRESYNIFATSGILFNHESPLRGIEFVTRKISDAVAKIKLNKQSILNVGNMNAKRDWGYAADFVEGMWKMMQADTPDTFILATGQTETVRNFILMAFKAVDIEIFFEGEGLDEKGIDKSSGKILVSVDPDFFRPAEVDLLIGDPSKAKENLGWEAKTSLEELCEMMVKKDIQRNI